MQRFILRQNIERFRSRIEECTDEGDRKRLRTMLAAAERELALLNTALSGVRDPLLSNGRAAPDAESRSSVLARFQQEFAGSPRPSLLIDPEAGLIIVDVNVPYEAATGAPRDRLLGQPLFLLFPDNPDDPDADGVSHLYASLKIVAETRRPHAMRDQRYDVRDDDGRFVERYWRPLNTPLLDEYGRLVYLLHQVEDVTEEVISARSPG